MYIHLYTDCHHLYSVIWLA